MSIARIISDLNAEGDPRKVVDPFIASLPQNIVSGAVARQEKVLREQAAEDEARVKAAYEAEVAAAEAEWTDSLHARTERWREGDPPEAAELNVDVSGLPPARAKLIRFAGWLGRERDQVRQLEAAREKFLSDLGAPQITERQLADIEAEDRSGFVSWLRSGADKATRPAVDEFRRQQVQAKLAEQTYSATVARESLAALEREIAVLRKAVELLDDRHPKFAQATLAEEAAAKVEAYIAAVDHLRSLAVDLGGLVRVAPGLHRGWPIREIKVDLPAFGDRKPRILIEEPEIVRAAGPWRERERALIADPRAVIGDAAD